MKIALLTLHKQNNNFGTVLQAHSLYSYLEEIGYDVELVDYCPYYMNGINSLSSGIKKIIANTLNLPYFLRRDRRFTSFVEEQKMTRRYSDNAQLLAEPPQADIYLIGSDQVWNKNYLCGRDPSYYLNFVQSPNKLSYAASVGNEMQSAAEVESLIRKIKNFRFVSFREKRSAEQLRENGRTDAKFVLDPVFLHSKEYYHQWESENPHKGYVLAYIMEKNNFLAQAAEDIARKYHKKIIEIGGFRSKCHSDFFDKSAGPREFLSYIRNADFVVTSSFHGTAFSLIYQKQFLSALPSRHTLRLTNILEASGTMDRLFDGSQSGLRLAENQINYKKVNARLSPVIASSKKYLEEALRKIMTNQEQRNG